ncbi:MAG: matrixin family metalloprotease [Deltaproteobacteria bacterium]|nr:matrixin family metalloprotease [Deltaproteobacteria bacterium]
MRLWRAIAMAAAALGVSPAAAGFQCSRVPPAGPSLYWNTRALTYAINRIAYPPLPAQDVYDAVRVSFETWQAPSCSDLSFTLLSLTDDRTAGYNWRVPEDNENLVVWRNGDAADPADAWRHERGSIAVTTTTFNSRTGELLDADIEFNGVWYQFTTCTPPAPGCTVAYDVQNTMTHEIGHFFGLDHPLPTEPDATEATMYSSAPRGETSKRDLAANDIEGLCFIYPAGQPTQQCFPAVPPAGSDPIFSQVGSNPDTGCMCSGDGATAAAPGGALLCLLAVGRRRSGAGRRAR